MAPYFHNPPTGFFMKGAKAIINENENVQMNIISAIANYIKFGKWFTEGKQIVLSANSALSGEYKISYWLDTESVTQGTGDADIYYKLLSTDDVARIEEVNNAARLLGYLRVLRHNIRRGALDNEEGKKIIDHALSNLRDLLEKADHLAI